MNLRKKINRSSLFKEYVKILNGILQLSPREAEVFSFILNADTWFPNNVNHKEVRQAIIDSLSISEPNLSHCLHKLKTKGLIVKGPEGKWVLNDNIRPVTAGDIVEVTITLDLNNDSSETSEYSKSTEE